MMEPPSPTTEEFLQSGPEDDEDEADPKEEAADLETVDRSLDLMNKRFGFNLANFIVEIFDGEISEEEGEKVKCLNGSEV